MWDKPRFCCPVRLVFLPCSTTCEEVWVASSAAFDCLQISGRSPPSSVFLCHSGGSCVQGRVQRGGIRGSAALIGHQRLYSHYPEAWVACFSWKQPVVVRICIKVCLVCEMLNYSFYQIRSDLCVCGEWLLHTEAWNESRTICTKIFQTTENVPQSLWFQFLVQKKQNLSLPNAFDRTSTRHPPSVFCHFSRPRLKKKSPFLMGC